MVQIAGSSRNLGRQQITEINLYKQTIARMYKQVLRIIAKNNFANGSVRTKTETESTVIRYGRSVDSLHFRQIRYHKRHFLFLRIDLPIQDTARDYHLLCQILIILLSLTAKER